MRPAHHTPSENARTRSVALPDMYWDSIIEDRHDPMPDDQIAVWVNEGGAGGEVVRPSDMSVAATTGVIRGRRTA
jgi:hypothetical protein